VNFEPDVAEAAVSVADELAARHRTFPKPVNVTHAMCERAQQALTKRQRADNLSEEHCKPKPANWSGEQHNNRKLFTA
jgi:hypothetical protein